MKLTLPATEASRQLTYEVVSGGTYWVYVTEADVEEILAAAEFTVIAAEIELGPDEGPVGFI